MFVEVVIDWLCFGGRVAFGMVPRPFDESAIRLLDDCSHRYYDPDHICHTRMRPTQFPQSALPHTCIANDHIAYATKINIISQNQESQ